MSCHSTPLSYAATYEAQMCDGGSMDESQVQSLYHALKREGENDPDLVAPTEEEYREGIEHSIWRIRNDESLQPKQQERLIARLETALDGPVPDAATWYAAENIRATVNTSRLAMGHLIRWVAQDLSGIEDEESPQLDSAAGQLEVMLEKWRDSDRYEDFAPPESEEFHYDKLRGMPQDKRTAKALRKLGYEHYLAQPLPVFVYGTLRAGQGNSGLMDGARLGYLPGTVKGVAVYGNRRYGFPYAAEHDDPESIARGEIVWLSHDDEGLEARRRLDMLEGFDSDFPTQSHYLRTRKTVVLHDDDGNEVERVAWMYLAQGRHAASLEERDRIPHGDWVAEKQALFNKR